MFSLISNLNTLGQLKDRNQNSHNLSPNSLCSELVYSQRETFQYEDHLKVLSLELMSNDFHLLKIDLMNTPYFEGDRAV